MDYDRVSPSGRHKNMIYVDQVNRLPYFECRSGTRRWGIATDGVVRGRQRRTVPSVPLSSHLTFQDTHNISIQ